MKSLLSVCAIGLLCACASTSPDRFYILSAQPQAAAQPQATTQPPTAQKIPATPVWLRITLPSLVDRPQMILNTSADGVVVLEHDRWGAPLADLVVQTLGQNIERRRGDLWVGGPSTVRPNGAAVTVTVDVVQMTARQGDRVSIEAHWRIVDSRQSTDVTGNEVFSAPLGHGGYSAIARGLSDCLAQLADELVTLIH
jgi:uncharacterized lipoprotein YmbA